MSFPDRSKPNLGKATTLGIMLNWLGDTYQQGIMVGVAEVAKAARANLLCFVGGKFPTDSDVHGR